MSNRSIWKGPFVDQKLLNRVIKVKMNANGREGKIKTWSKKSTILPNFINLTFSVYNGKNFSSLFIIDSMIGKKIGEFIRTRKFIKHTKNKK